MTQRMVRRIHLEPRDVPPAFLRAFPSYRGRKFTAEVTESVSLTGTYWDGGTRSRYALLRVADGRASIAPPDHPFFDRRGIEGTTHQIPPGFIVVEHCIFCGKDLGLTFYVRPDMAAPLLPDPVGELDEQRKRILGAFAGLKSGEYRRKALAGLGFTDSIRDELAAGGYLKVSRNGACGITTKGRNACEGVRVH